MEEVQRLLQEMKEAEAGSPHWTAALRQLLILGIADWADLNLEATGDDGQLVSDELDDWTLYFLDPTR